MFEKLSDQFKYHSEKGFSVPEPEKDEAEITGALDDDILHIKTSMGSPSDLMVRELVVSGERVAVVLCEALFSTQVFGEVFLRPLQQVEIAGCTPQKLRDWAENNVYLGNDQKTVKTFGDLYRFVMSGFAVLLIDGAPGALAVGVQGFPARSVGEPDTEVNIRGSKEGFCEIIRFNIAMVRRRLKTPRLRFDMIQVGTKSKTDVCVTYLSDTASEKTVEMVKKRLEAIKTDVVLDSGYLMPYLDRSRASLFSGIGVTERPDVLVAKLSEGRIGVLVDGTPFALVVPYLFNENFQSVDDYAQSAYYATFIRVLKYFSFLFSIFTPGLYIAVVNFHPELLPEGLLLNIAASAQGAPFPLAAEALFMHFVYEIMREAGLRLPRPIGHAVGIIGALVVGDAAVTAGFVSSPMVMVVALTAISSFVIPSLYEPVTVLRFVMILVGGAWGIYGIALAAAVVGMNLCAVNPYGVPATAPAAPFRLSALRDVFWRENWRGLGGKTMRIDEMPGSNSPVPDKEGKS